MALRLTIVSNNGPSLGTRSVKEFGPNGGTIGRSVQCDWALPDPKRYLSSRHASIDFRSGSYYIVDTSMNGVYVNDAEQPVGRGKPQRLFDGDRLRIGEYEISVEIDEDPIAPLIEENHIDPVDLAQRVEAPEPTGEEMVDAYEITGVGIEMMLTEDELETLHPPPKSKGAYFEIIDGPSTDASARGSGAAASAAAKAGAAALADTDVFEATQPVLLAPRRPAATAAATKPAAKPRKKPARAAAPNAAPAGAAQPATAAPNVATGPRTPAAQAPAAPPTAAAPAVGGAAPASPSAGAPAMRAAPVSAARTLAGKPSAPTGGSVGAAHSAPVGGAPQTATSAQPSPAAQSTPPAQPAPAAPAAPTAQPTSAAQPSQAAQPAPAARPAQAAQPAPLRGRALDLEPFFRGAGVSPIAVPPQKADAFLFGLGQIVRAMIVGLTESLHLVAQQKNALRLTGATPDDESDNPLKLPTAFDETFANLLLRESPDLPPVDAVRDAFDDLQLHQQVVLKAVRSALDTFVARLDPEELESKFTRGRGNVLVNAANRLKYWDFYKDLYDVVAHHPPGELPLQFLEDFAQAYEQELEHLENGPAPAAERQAG